MKNQNEYEKRCKAIQLYEEGFGFNKVLQLVQRSRRWLSKCLKRFKEHGINGLKDQSRVPKRIWRKTAKRLVKKILSIREELESHKTRRSAFSGIGAEVIHWELKQRKVHNIPAISTIANILSRHGKTSKVKPKRNSNNQPYPYFKAEKMGDLHQTDLVGPRHLRGSKGVTRFYSFHTVDVAQGIQPLQVSLLINKPSLSANIWLRHGDLWAFPQYPRWIMRWLLQVEGVILISFLRLFACTCSWGYIWYLSHRENPAGMPLLRVSTPSGKKELFIGIAALPFLSVEKPANNSCNIIIMRNLTEVLLKKNMAQDSLECLKTTSGNPY